MFNIYNYASQHEFDNFRPTFLYIKQHNITGKLYFGKTYQQNVETYKGQGSYWKAHRNKYGKNDISTIWYCLFTDIYSLVETAILLSESMGVISDQTWANMKIETGLDNSTGTKHSEESKQNMRKPKNNKENMGHYNRTPEIREKISKSKTGKSNIKLSEKRSGGNWYKNLEHSVEVYILSGKVPPDNFIPGRIINVSGKNNGAYGSRRSQEWKKEHSTRMKNRYTNKPNPQIGQKRSEEFRQQMSEIAKTRTGEKSVSHGRLFCCIECRRTMNFTGYSQHIKKHINNEDAFL